MKKLISIVLALGLAACQPTPKQAPDPTSPQVVLPSSPTPASFPSPTENWIDAGNNGVAGVQFQPVKSDGNNAQFWMRVVFNKPLSSGDRIQVMFQEADCQQGIYYSRYLARFDSNGQMLSQGVPPDANQPVVVQADSSAETAFKLSCSNNN